MWPKSGTNSPTFAEIMMCATTFVSSPCFHHENKHAAHSSAKLGQLLDPGASERKKLTAYLFLVREVACLDARRRWMIA
jgi:hypothetical protein